jgi:hypothetical protein
MLNRQGNSKKFAEAGRLPILARGRSIKNSVSEVLLIFEGKMLALTICLGWKKTFVFHIKWPYFSPLKKMFFS